MSCDYFLKQQCKSCTNFTLGVANSFKLKTNKISKELKILFPTSTEEQGFYLEDYRESRCKSKLIANLNSNKQIDFGITNSTGNFTELMNCPLHFQILNTITKKLSILVNEFAIEPYHIVLKKGELKGVIIVSNSLKDELILKIILRSKKEQHKIEKIFKIIQEQYTILKVLVINIQPIAHAILEGDKEFILSDSQFIYEKYNDLTFFFGSKSFIQVTPVVAEKLYDRASQWTLNDRGNFLDLYCGVGTFSLHYSKVASSVLGIEISKDAISAANKAVKFNNIKNCNFQVGDLNSIKLNDNFSVISVNPPRRGLDENVLDFLLNSLPPKIIYSSCNAETLIRDLNILSKKYRVTKYSFFDLFPLTNHVETLVELIR
jgi:23S rRNA (uracil747-C5)-methyltransferase